MTRVTLCSRLRFWQRLPRSPRSSLRTSGSLRDSPCVSTIFHLAGQSGQKDPAARVSSTVEPHQRFRAHSLGSPIPPVSYALGTPTATSWRAHTRIQVTSARRVGSTGQGAANMASASSPASVPTFGKRATGFPVSATPASPFLHRVMTAHRSSFVRALFDLPTRSRAKRPSNTSRRRLSFSMTGQ